MSTQHQPLPLEGVRVLDFTLVYAGPYGTMQLADWGAEVIRVESIKHFANSTRGQMARPPKEYVAARANMLGYPNNDPGERPWNRVPLFNAHGRNKLSMTVDLTRPEGQEVLERLVRISDGLLENNVPVSMEKVGVTWERLSRVNPRLILVRMPGFGIEGPYKNYRTWGNIMEGLAGHPLLRAYPDESPMRAPSGVPSDAASGIGGALGFLMGLFYREAMGKGLQIELPMTDNFLPFLGEFILDYTMNGRVRTQLGNTHDSFAPHNAYPCEGEDRRITIACRNDQEWQTLCKLMERPDLADDPRFQDQPARLRNRKELDAVLSEWTLTQDRMKLMHTLQAAGVPAGALLDAKDAFEDPHLRARGFFETLTHPEAGTHEYVGPLFHMDRTPNHLRRHAPRLGEDNEYVYRQLLGFSDKEYRRFEEAGHIGMDYDPSIP